MHNSCYLVSILRQSRRLYGCWPLEGAFSQPLKAKARTTAKTPKAKPGNTPGIVKLLLPPRPSRPGELHPEPLTDPDMTLSRHPARAVRERLSPFIQVGGFLPLPVDPTWIGPPTPSLHCDYGSFVTAARWSAPYRSIGSFRLSFLRLYVFPFHLRAGSQVPHESLNESHASSAPDTAWTVNRYLPC